MVKNYSCGLPKSRFFSALLLLVAMLVGGVETISAETTYKLQKVTSVEAGGLYVFEQGGHVMSSGVDSQKALLTTTDYKTIGLTGTEKYVWSLETAKGGFYMKNDGLSSNQYLNNTKDKTDLSFGSKTSIWAFTLQNDNTFLINNPGNSNRLLAYPDEKTFTYKAYAASNASTSPHAIVVYRLVEEKVVESPAPAAPLVFHDAGEYVGTLTVPMVAEKGAEIYYTLDGGAETKYAAPVAISATTTVAAWAVKDGVKSDVVTKTFTIVEVAKGPSVAEGYYQVKNNEAGIVNVAGRKTVTFVTEADAQTKAGTVLRVKATDGQLEVLRSQGVDLPRYADRAMTYVPKIVELVAQKLKAEGSGELLGTDGLKLLMDKFEASFDYHLYLEESNGSYRIYGRTPSMQPVVEFYAENKANVDYKLPQLEAFINSAIEKVLSKTGGSGKSILVPFSLETVWQNMGGTLTNPKEDQAKFYEEVLSSEQNVWQFAYQTAMIYWGKLKEHQKFQEMKSQLGDYAKYIDKVEQIRPNFKYYLAANGKAVDVISEGNSDLKAARALWTMTARTDFAVAFPEENVLNGKYYTTLYTDFAYTLPEGVKAYKVTEVNETSGVAKKVELEGTVPAQTPVLLESDKAENQTFTLSTENGTAPKDNLLKGPDYLIKTYEIKTAQVVSLFDMAKSILGESAYNSYLAEYEHLMLRNAGTVNNKYFFGVTDEDLGTCANEEGYISARCLDKRENSGLGFYENWKVTANKAFLVSEKFDPVKLTLIGDINRDGVITIADVTALVNIILGKDNKQPYQYDHDAANVNCDDKISIADVTALVNIILGK